MTEYYKTTFNGRRPCQNMLTRRQNHSSRSIYAESSIYQRPKMIILAKRSSITLCGTRRLISCPITYSRPCSLITSAKTRNTNLETLELPAKRRQVSLSSKLSCREECRNTSEKGARFQIHPPFDKLHFGCSPARFSRRR
jgi:hypothetical protein